MWIEITLATIANMNRSWNHFKKLIATQDLPELGPEPRADRLALVELNQILDRFAAEGNLPAVFFPLVRSATLLWHDYLDESHALSQGIHNVDGSLVHGIMHRREPDYANAKYWFHRVGDHPCFREIARKADELLTARGEKELSLRLIPRGQWDPFAFIDACEEVVEIPPLEPRRQTLQAIQEIEFDALLAHIYQLA